MRLALFTFVGGLPDMAPRDRDPFMEYVQGMKDRMGNRSAAPTGEPSSPPNMTSGGRPRVTRVSTAPVRS